MENILKDYDETKEDIKKRPNSMINPIKRNKANERRTARKMSTYRLINLFKLF